MKYENFERARSIDDSIKTAELKLFFLGQKEIWISIMSSSERNKNYVIESFAPYGEEDINTVVVKIIESLKQDYQKLIDTLKKELEEL